MFLNKCFNFRTFGSDLVGAFQLNWSSKSLSDKLFTLVVYGTAIGIWGEEIDYLFYGAYRGLVMGYALFLVNSITTAAAPKLTKYALVAIAVLYNPIFPIHLGDPLSWLWINIFTLAIFHHCRTFTSKTHSEVE